MYKVLVPKYTKAGFTSDGKQQYSVSWDVVGEADNLEQARKLTPAPVLEKI